MLPKKHLTPEEKKEYLLKKYNKQEQEININDYKQYAVVYKNTDDPDELSTWDIVAVCDTKEEALKEIEWRMKFHKTNNTQIVIDNDKRFKTFEDETKHKDNTGKYIAPTDDQLYNTPDLFHNANSIATPAKKDQFKTLNHYNAMALDYRGYYTIQEIYHIK